MSVASKIIYKKNSQIYQITGLTDNSVSPATYLNAATVVATLKDPSGNPVTGFNNISGVFVPASNGVYNFSIDASVDPEPGGGYVLAVTATQGGKQWYIEAPIKIKVRQSGTEV